MFSTLNSQSFTKQYKSASELVLNEKYKVKELKKIITKYGDKILCITNEDFDVILPSRFLKLLPEEFMKSLNQAIREENKSVFIKSLGPIGRTTNVLFLEE